MSILPLALFTNRLIYVHSCLIYVHSNLMVSEGISPHSFTDGKLRLEDISPAAYIMEMSATTVFCSQLCLVFSGQSSSGSLALPSRTQLECPPACHPPRPTSPQTHSSTLPPPSLSAFRPPLTSSPFTGPVSSCPAGGMAASGGGSSGCTQIPGGWSHPPRLHLTGEAEELLCGGRGQVSGCHVFRQELIFRKPFLCTRTREAFDIRCLS